MNVVLFTPVAKTSAIGRMASLVSRQLIELGHQVVVIRTEEKCFFGQPTHDFGTQPISWHEDDEVSLIAQSADGLIYQIGDNYLYHSGALAWLPRFPGIVCLHDFFIANLFCAWARQHRSSGMRVLKTWYEAMNADQFFRYDSAESLIEGTRHKAPMTEWVCAMAKGVVTHSGWDIERVLKSCPGPVYTVPLAYSAPDVEQQATHQNKNHFRLLTVGYVNKNKRAESVISAIGNLPDALRKVMTYQLIGDITPEHKQALCALAQNKQVNLIILGFVDGATLAKYICQADLMICLRWPALEAASASAIESLLYGKATVVTDTGFYSEMPDQYVIKINPDNEIADLQRILERFQRDPDAFKAMGLKAKQWAAKTYTADNYAHQLVDMVLATTRSNVITQATDYFAKIMYDWGADFTMIDKKQLLEPLGIFE